MPLLPGAAPFTHRGSATGVLLCHGFAGSPGALRPWAEWLAGRGLTVSLPLLPGHGTRRQELAPTRWQDWYAAVDRAFRELNAACARVFLCGLSLGGALALRLAARRGPDVSGLALVNPAVTFPRPRGGPPPVLRHLLPSVANPFPEGARPGGRESGYPRVPSRAAHSARALLSLVRDELPHVTQPLLVMRDGGGAAVPADAARVRSAVSSTDVTELVLESSPHVAPLEHGAQRIFQETDAFISRLSTRKTARDGT